MRVICTQGRRAAVIAENVNELAVHERGEGIYVINAFSSGDEFTTLGAYGTEEVALLALDEVINWLCKNVSVNPSCRRYIMLSDEIATAMLKAEKVLLNGIAGKSHA